MVERQASRVLAWRTHLDIGTPLSTYLSTVVKSFHPFEGLGTLGRYLGKYVDTLGR